MNSMSTTITLKLEQIKDEDFIDDECNYAEPIGGSKLTLDPNTTECGRILLDLEENTWIFCCVFCETTFQKISVLLEHVTAAHITLSSGDFKDLLELESSMDVNHPEINQTLSSEKTEASNDEEEIIPDNIPQSADTKLNRSSLHKCEICDKTFRFRYKFQEHISTHNELPFKCDQCSKAFRTKKILHYHTAIHSGTEKNFKCSHCDQIFEQKRYLQMHLSYHFRGNAFPCTVCQKPNRTAHQLKVHMVKHTSKKEHVCEICGSSYGLRHHLVTHQRQKHENKREYKCNKCDRAFNTLTFLNNHKLSHTKERKHICTVCGAGFVWRKNLIEHFKLHSNTKEYNCEECGKAFAQKSGLISHTKTHVC